MEFDSRNYLFEVVSSTEQECIYLEKGLYLRVKVRDILLRERGAITLKLQATHREDSKKFWEHYKNGMFSVGSVSMTLDEGVLHAGSYISWSLIFTKNRLDELKDHMEQHLSKTPEKNDRYRIAREFLQD